MISRTKESKDFRGNGRFCHCHGDVTDCDKNIMQVVFSLVAVYYAVSHCAMAGVVEGERNISKKIAIKK